MPLLELADLDRYAVVWEIHGWTRETEPVLKYPVQVPCRWVDNRRESLNPLGQTVATDADVAVCCEVPIGSLMWLGKISDISGTATPPTPTEDLYQVVTAKSARDIKGRTTRSELRLMRFNDTMPTIVDVLE